MRSILKARYVVWVSCSLLSFAASTAWGGDLRVKTTVLFSALDGGPDDEDGVTDGILTLSSLTLISDSRIVVDVATAGFNVAGDVKLVGTSMIGPDPKNLLATGPTITIALGGSVLMAGSSTLLADGTDAGGTILVCAGGDIDVGGLAAAIASSSTGPNGVHQANGRHGTLISENGSNLAFTGTHFRQNRSSVLKSGKDPIEFRPWRRQMGNVGITAPSYPPRWAGIRNLIYFQVSIAKTSFSRILVVTDCFSASPKAMTLSSSSS